MKIRISPSLPLFLISLALSGDARLLLVPLFAAAIHESGHLLAARVLNIPIKSIRLSVFGALIDADVMNCSYKSELLLAISGPMANIVTAIIAYFFAENSIFFVTVSLFLALLNLIPAGSLDGGRILSSVLNSLLSQTVASRISEAVSFLCFFTLWTVSVYIIMKTGAYLSLFIFSCSLFTRLFFSDYSLRPK